MTKFVMVSERRAINLDAIDAIGIADPGKPLEISWRDGANTFIHGEEAKTLWEAVKGEAYIGDRSLAERSLQAKLDATKEELSIFKAALYEIANKPFTDDLMALEMRKIAYKVLHG